MNVGNRADAVGTFRCINVMLMEMLAGWVPSTPEMEVKVLFGRHIWLVAQHADQLGKRARELRAPLNYSRPPREGYLQGLKALAAVGATEGRLEGFYEMLLPSLAAVYRHYIEHNDRLVDEPTILICEGALRDIERMQTEHVQLRQELASLRKEVSVLPQGLHRTFSEARDIVDESREETAGQAAR